MFRLCRLLLRHVGLILRFPVGGLGGIISLLLPGHRLHTRPDFPSVKEPKLFLNKQEQKSAVFLSKNGIFFKEKKTIAL